MCRRDILANRTGACSSFLLLLYLTATENLIKFDMFFPACADLKPKNTGPQASGLSILNPSLYELFHPGKNLIQEGKWDTLKDIKYWVSFSLRIITAIYIFF